MFQVLRVAALFGVISAGFSKAAAADAPAPIPLDRVIQSISLPEGFQATLFAAEPNVVQPIAMTTDSRGRLWVVECLSYPDWSTNQFGPDRVVVFEDEDGDGAFDHKKTFYDKGRNLTGIAVGMGGVWLCSLPELIFIPDRDRDDLPDGPPEVLLDGWDLRSQHNAFNGLNWGPDGWLYGSNGILGASLVGAPGTPEAQRTPMNCGVWRYHPTRRIFEVVAHGTTNPWGVAFNSQGDMFVANCVIKHLFHIVPGGRYERMFGQDFNSYSFQLIPSIADHIHWAGGHWKTEGAENPKNDDFGGGHAHSGALIYNGGNWPEKYHGAFLTVNIHGHRLNHDTLAPERSGYIGRHNPDFFIMQDSWFRGVAVVPSHDGGIFVADWSDAGECHDYEDIQRENGRIYKISYGARRSFAVDLSRATDADLIASLGEKNEWVATQARLILQQRAVERRLDLNTNLALIRLLRDGAPHARLRALWALHVTTGLGEQRISRLLQDPDEWIRAWTVQLALDTEIPRERIAPRLAEIAPEEKSPVVRRFLASALQKLAPADRLILATPLVRHAQDTADPNIPLLLWYGIEPIASQDDTGSIALLEQSRLPLVRRFIAQRLALRGSFDGVTRLLSKSTDAQVQADIVHGLHGALNGRKGLTAPAGWDAVAQTLEKHPQQNVRHEAVALSLIFGDPRSLDQLIRRASDASRPAAERVQALESLNTSGRPELLPLLQRFVNDKHLRLSAIKGLAAYDHRDTPRLLVEGYRDFSPEEKAEAISTLSSRAEFAAALLQAITANKIPARDVTPFTLRQIQAYKNPRLETLLKQVGSVREISGDKAAQIARYKQLLIPAALEQANLSRGRALYARTCAGCHKLFDEGSALAPELTGSQRSSIDYILENVVDPNSVVWDQYKASYFEMNDDRLISGVVVRENESTVTVQSPTGMITVPRADIVSRTKSQLSLMPEGLFETLEDQEIIDLVGYLQSPVQVPLEKATK